MAGLTLILGIDWSYGIAVVLLMGAMFKIVGVKPVRAKSSAEWRWSDFLGGFVFVWQKKPVLGAISLDLFAVLFGGAVALLPALRRTIAARRPGRARPAARRARRRRGAGGVARSACDRSRRHVGHLDVRRRRRVRPVHDRRGSVDQPVALGGRARVAGAGDMVSVFVRSMLVQLETPDAIRGRVSAVNAMFIGASNELGAFRAGVQAAWMGIVPSMIWGGVCTLAVVGSYLGCFRSCASSDRFPDARALASRLLIQ